MHTGSDHDKYLGPQWTLYDSDDLRHTGSSSLSKETVTESMTTRVETQIISPFLSNMAQSPREMAWLEKRGRDRQVRK